MIYVLCLKVMLLVLSNEVAAQDLQYHMDFSLACHNCYESHISGIEDVFNYTNTIEIDIFDSEIFTGKITNIIGGNRLTSDWYVKHEFQNRGNKNCCGGTFITCMERIKNWSEENPGHNAITIFIDKKENWSREKESRKPSDLDRVILSIFTREKIYTPNDLQKDKHCLKDAVPENWASMDSIKGKFIFVITDGSMNINSRSPIDEYLSQRKNDAVCFTAPEISTKKEIINPPGISKENARNVVFYNLKYSGRRLAGMLNTAGYISRVYNCPETMNSFNELVAGKVNFIALYNYQLK